MLPLFGLLLFALLGIGALVVDGGLALTEQARLETASEMMVAEWEHLRTDASSRPGACELAGVDAARRTRCLEALMIAPLIEPLGARVSAAGAGLDWRTEDVSLDGRAIDSRGARFGALDVASSLGLDAAPGTSDVRLARSSPLLLGWTARTPEGRDDDRPDFGAIQAARRAEGIRPELGGTGLRGEGFALAAGATIDTERVPAMRVGHLGSPDHRATTGELVGLAWRLEDLQSGASVLDPLVDPSAVVDLTLDADALREGGRVVACRFDPSGGAHVGEPLALTATAGSVWPGANGSQRVWGAGYVPVVAASEACGSARVLGFLELRVDAQRLPTVGIGRPQRRRRNALSTPGSAAEARLAGAIWESPARTRLVETPAWRVDGLDLALRVPRIVDLAPVRP